MFFPVAVICVFVILYLVGVYAFGKKYREVWGTDGGGVCPECGSSAACQARWWPLREVGGIPPYGERCDYCGSIVVQWSPVYQNSAVDQ
jgi:hypothetical protein